MRNKLWLGHLAFILSGAANTVLGPILPALALRWSLDDVHAGQLFTAEFLGAVLGTILASPSMARVGLRRTSALGLVAMAAGIASVGISGPRAGLACVACLGFGLGFGAPPINLWIARADPLRSSAATNLVNASWCIGAASSAPLIIYLGAYMTLPRILAGLAVLLLLMAAAIGAEREPLPSIRLDARASGSTTQWSATDRREFIWVLSAIIFVYVGTESGIGGWVTTYAKRLSLFPPAGVGFAQSTFFGALMIGRFLAPVFLRRMKPWILVLLGLNVSSAGLALSVSVLAPAPVLAGLFIAGFGFAAVFPTTVATFSDRLGAEAIRLYGWIFPLGYVGAAAIPLAMGAASETFHALRYGMIVALACIFILIALQVQIIRILRREAADSPQAG